MFIHTSRKQWRKPLLLPASILCSVFLVGCNDEGSSTSDINNELASIKNAESLGSENNNSNNESESQVNAQSDVAVVNNSQVNQLSAIKDSDYFYESQPEPLVVELGKALFFDKILSGNQNIACSTCHHPEKASGDELSLPVGEGGQGLGIERHTGVGNELVKERVPRNSPTLFNLGLKQFSTLFHDGRLSVNAAMPSGFDNPAGDQLPEGLDNILAAQAMFPITSAVEMAGQPGENPVADAASHGNFNGAGGVWRILEERIKAIPEYQELFQAAFNISEDEISYVHVANAIAALETVTFRADNSPFDQYLRGQKDAMNEQAIRGMDLFYSTAGCSSCHSGVLQTDHQFHAIAMPQIGPGKGDGTTGLDDFGRERVTKESGDRYKFRTPNLRNVALTAPYGHSGAYRDLDSVLAHHIDPEAALAQYDCETQPVLPFDQDLSMTDCTLMQDRDGKLTQSLMVANELKIPLLNDEERAALIAFLQALTDESSHDLSDLTPDRVPSGLPVVD